MCENGNGEGLSRMNRERKRKLHSEREGHRTAESWVGGGKERRGGPTSGLGVSVG